MKFVKSSGFLVIFGTFCTLNQAQYAELPTDMRYPCQMNGYDEMPIDEPIYSDTRLKRQQKKLSLGAKIEELKMICAKELGFPIEELPEDMLNVQKASRPLKCLMTCMLKRLKLVTDENLVSIDGIETLANEVGRNNPLVTSIAIALAEQFNERMFAMQIKDPCEVGYIINQYISKELKDRKLSIPY